MAADSRYGELSLIRSWLARHSVLPVVGATLALAAIGQIVPLVVWTPQFSGAEASITLRTGAAAVAGGCYAALVLTQDPIAEIRSTRNVRLLRWATAFTVLGVGIASLGLGPSAAWDWSAVRTYMFVAAVTSLIARAAGLTAAAAVLGAYIGACLFAGVPQTGAVRWWAVPVQPATEPSIGIMILMVAASAAVMLAHRTPPLPSDHRARRMALDLRRHPRP